MKQTRSLASTLGILASSAMCLLLLGSVAMAGEATASNAVADCTATFNPSHVTAQAEPMTVRATLTKDLSAAPEVTIDNDSGVRLKEVKLLEPDTLELRIDTSAAAAGEWSISFVTGETVCRGSLVVPASPTR